MEITINYFAVLVCAVFAMIVGFVWYGPFFGKKWMEIMKCDPNDKEKMKEAQKGMWKLYLTNFVLVLFQVWVLAYYVVGWSEVSGVQNALWIWAGFVMPTIAAGAMWNNDSAKVSWARFLIQAGYQFVMFVIFGFVLSMWK